MRVLLVVVALVCVGAAACDPVACALQWADTNEDAALSAAEINAFVANQPCGPRELRVTGERVVEACDGNADGVLSAADTGCVTPGISALVCSICAQCESHHQ